jgi:CheY-like chemotaxis protein
MADTVASPSSPRTILVVEDDPDIRDAVLQMLEAEGFTVATASNGQEGLERLDEIGRPCLVLLDMMMPVMDGATFLARLAEDPVRCTYPVIVVTASRAPVPPGAKAILRKPYEIDDLFALVEAHCSRE